MGIEQFEHVLRQLVRQEPFRPFLVDMVDGRILTVDQPVVFGGGGASYITLSDEWVEFACEDVQAIRPDVPRATP